MEHIYSKHKKPLHKPKRRSISHVESEPSTKSCMLKTRLCKWVMLDKCLHGEYCKFAHTTAEQRTKPVLLLTKMCVRLKEHKICSDGDNCNFAHSLAELRSLNDPLPLNAEKYKLNNTLTAKMLRQCVRHNEENSNNNGKSIQYTISDDQISAHYEYTNDKGNIPVTNIGLKTEKKNEELINNDKDVLDAINKFEKSLNRSKNFGSNNTHSKKYTNSGKVKRINCVFGQPSVGKSCKPSSNNSKINVEEDDNADGSPDNPLLYYLAMQEKPWGG